MSYQKQQFVDNETVLMAHHLQHMEDGIAANDSAVTGMNTATSSDQGKALKAKTVANGKVTAWEFGETATIDPTLSHQGQAADAKATGDMIQVSSTQPSEQTVKLWVKPESEEYQVPTYAEHEELADEVTDLKSETIRKHGQLTAAEVTAGGYTDLIQLPTGFSYSVASGVSIGGKPTELRASPFNFISIPTGISTVAVPFALYLAIGADVSYYGFGANGDTTISWKRIDNGDNNIIALKNRINGILGENIQWEKGYIPPVGTGNTVVYDAQSLDSYVHTVIDVTAGDVVYLTATADAIMITVDASDKQTRRSTQSSLNDFAYTIASGDAKLIVNARADRPYDVYIKSASNITIAQLTADVGELSESVAQISESVGDGIKKHGTLTAAEISAGGYTDLIQLPTGFSYGVASGVSIGGKPVGLRSSPFNFISIPALKNNVAVTYTYYLAIGTDISYYGFGLVGDTTISWHRIDNSDSNVLALKNKINGILGESFNWEKGYIAAVSTGNTIDYTALNTDSYVHTVISVATGDVVHITSTAGVSAILITANSSDKQTRRSTQSSLNDFAYTIASGDTKIIVNARADQPYDVYIKSASADNIVTLTTETAKSLKKAGLLTAAQVSAGGYTDLIQLPQGYVYGIANSVSIGGKPTGLQSDHFTFASIAPQNGLIFSEYYAIGKHCAYYGLGYSGDTTISWRQFEPGEKPFDTITGPNVVLLGDSITQGVGSSDYSPTGEDVPNTVYQTKRNVGVKAWGAQFVNLLNSDFNCTAVNNGVSTIGVNGINSNLSTLLPSGTNMVVLIVGTNDRGSSAANFRTAFTTLVRNIKDKGVKLFVFSPIPVNGASASMGMGNMQKVIERVCQENEVTFYPLYTLFRMYLEENNLTPGNYYDDTLHPNDAGHKLIYQIVCKCLKV